MLLPLLPALLAALAPPLPCCCRAWAPHSGPAEEDQQPPPPLNSSFAAAAGGVAEGRPGATEQAGHPGFPTATTGAAPSPGPPRAAPQQQQQPREEPACNISVQRQMLSSLLVRWSPLGLQCDLVLFSTGGAGGRAFFSAAFHRVGPPPLLIEHVGLAAGGVQQDLRLCVGCSWARGGRVGRLRPGGSSGAPAAAAASPAASFFASSLPDPGQPWQQGERLHFCCLDFSLEELKGDSGWRLNRKPIESTLVACFMTLVIIVWSVAALIWPVPIIAGFLPNGMEQRRGAAAGAAPTAK
ncbi:transmembrane protein 158 [Sphaerodactylus townsendi]|uniref:transmembrane protein 158 n=1 Tax=Sphaerodactylus townsendi TaxID=933632 RepID=UPI0020263AD4|nr:transmembrane protein 158 [Sphaerodactylus townsendi]